MLKKYQWLITLLEDAFGKESIIYQASDYGAGLAVGVKLNNPDGSKFKQAMVVEGYVHSHEGECIWKTYIDDEGEKRKYCSLPMKLFSLNKEKDKKDQVKKFIEEIVKMNAENYALR